MRLLAVGDIEPKVATCCCQPGLPVEGKDNNIPTISSTLNLLVYKKCKDKQVADTEGMMRQLEIHPMGRNQPMTLLVNTLLCLQTEAWHNCPVRGSTHHQN